MGFNSSESENGRKQINRQKIERIHQEHPDKHGQRKRRNEGTVAVHNIFCLIVYHLNDHFHKNLKSPWHTGCRPAGGAKHKETAEHTHNQRPQHCVEVDDGEINKFILVCRRKMAQVVNNVFRRGRRVRRPFTYQFRCHVSA